MKTLFIVMVIGCSPCLVSAAVPSQQIIHGCLKTESVSNGHYDDISPRNFTVDEDEFRNRTSKTISHRRNTVGIWESMDSEAFGLVYNTTFIPSAKIIKLGSEPPTPFIPFTAKWGEARQGKSRYVCITFNFEGLGQSGSYQNIRGLYLIEVSKRPPKFYYMVGDIRDIKD
jgi:hypothetical protein